MTPPTSPQPRANAGRGRIWLRRLARMPVLFIALTTLQVLAARWLDPVTTFTMLERSWDHHQEHGVWRSVDWEVRELDALGPHLPRLAPSAEDAWFYHHYGLDLGAIKEAAAYNRSRAEGQPRRGASTITQQTAKNLFLWQRRGWFRKGLETWYAVLLDLLVPKERILELYLNIAETGPMTFGVEAGAQRWFGEPAQRLNEAEAAQLVAILPNPRQRDPRSSSNVERGRRIVANRVLVPDDPGYDKLAEQWADRWYPWRRFMRWQRDEQ